MLLKISWRNHKELGYIKSLNTFVRPRVITFKGTGFLPNTRLYVFFDQQDVNSFVTPASSDFTTDATIVAGSPLITTAAGKVEGTFEIPEYRFPRHYTKSKI